MATFDGILSGQADQAPFWFPWAYHGTPTRNLPAIAESGLTPAPSTYAHVMTQYVTARGGYKRLPVLFFAPCPAFAASYAVGAMRKGVLLRFAWPEDARSWVSDIERMELAALYQACTTGVIPPFKPYRKHGKLVKRWPFVDAQGRVPRYACNEESRANIVDHEYVSAHGVPPEAIEVYVGKIDPAMTRKCKVDDRRFLKTKWRPLLDYVRLLKKLKGGKR